MRLKSLLFLWLLAGIASAQDTINYLIISEYRGNNPSQSYVELTNMGDQPVQLSDFKIGHWGGGNTLDYVTGKTNTNSGSRIPVDKLLQPGESFLIASYLSQNEELFKQFLGGTEKAIQDNMLERADLIQTPNDPLGPVFSQQWGGNGMFLMQHLSNGDSLVVDQVGGTFTREGGLNPDRIHPESYYPVAGVDNALRTCYLIRKASVETGTLDFNSARGVGLDDSEWIPIPFYGDAWRLAPWTIGNHGDYNLDASTLVSTEVAVDFDSKTLNVPWGVRRGDNIMSYFEEKPNIAWIYEMAGSADSLTHAAQTGDKLHVYVLGNDLDYAAFNIVVAEPAEDANMVVKRTNPDPNGFWRTEISSGSWGWPRVTDHGSANDTIWGVRGGIPYATRVDSLLKQLDKPANAEWRIEFNGGVVKPDLSDGDKLIVNGVGQK